MACRHPEFEVKRTEYAVGVWERRGRAQVVCLVCGATAAMFDWVIDEVIPGEVVRED